MKMEGDTFREGILFLLKASPFIGFFGCMFGSYFAFFWLQDQKDAVNEIAYQVQNSLLRERIEEAKIQALMLAIPLHKQTTAMVIAVIMLIGIAYFGSELYPTVAEYFATKYGIV